MKTTRFFHTQEDLELFELQQLKLNSNESFDYKQGYDFAINEINSQYNLRHKKNNEPFTKNNSQNQNKTNVEAPNTKVLQIIPRENKQNSNPSSPKKSISPNIFDITNEIAESSKDAPKSNTIKASNPVKITILDPKKNPVDSKSANPKTDNTKTAAENSKSDRTSATTQTVLEKRIKNSKSQETQT